MPRFRHSTFFLLVAGFGASAMAANEAQQLVVLRNGNILRGSVERAGDHWRVVSAGTELYLRTAEVDFLCESVEGAYQQYRERLVPPSAVGHMHLAAWCLRHELWEAAGSELAAARQLEPNHPRLVILEQTAAHLQQAAQSKRPTPNSSAEKPSKTTTPDGSNRESFTELPEGALEDFTRRIQPILVNNCTTSGCHRVDGREEFQLNRDLLHGMANRRSTMRNLVATLHLLNAESPLDSDLLAQASAAHAGMESPPLPVHQPELYRRLEEWVLLVSGKDPPEAASPDNAVQFAGGSEARSGELISADAATIGGEDYNVVPTGYEEDLLSAPATPKPLRVGVKLKSWLPRDEFDPEIYNRRYAKELEPQPSGAAVEK